MRLNNYRSSYNQKLKEIKNLNQAKNNERKKLDHQKFFVGGVFLSLNENLNPQQDKAVPEILIEMCKIYTILQVSNKKDEFIAEFDENQHLPVFSDISEKLAFITQDPKNPFRKK